MNVNAGVPGNPVIGSAPLNSVSPDMLQAIATMALAAEVRLQNLIAYQANVVASYVDAPKIPRSNEADALNAEIKARLGLT